MAAIVAVERLRTDSRVTLTGVVQERLSTYGGVVIGTIIAKQRAVANCRIVIAGAVEKHARRDVQRRGRSGCISQEHQGAPA